VRRRSEFQLVFDRGSRTQGRFYTILVAPNELRTPRLGIVASKKLGGAVVRNRAKRLIRDMFRRSETLPTDRGLDLVVIPRRELLEASPSARREDFEGTVKRAARQSSRRAG
jgi:ribonuclease P protein component